MINREIMIISVHHGIPFLAKTNYMHLLTQIMFIQTLQMPDQRPWNIFHSILGLFLFFNKTI